MTEKAPTKVAIFSFPFGDLFDKNGITAGVSSWRKFSDMSTPPQAKMGGELPKFNYRNTRSKKKWGMMRQSCLTIMET